MLHKNRFMEWLLAVGVGATSLSYRQYRRIHPLRWMSKYEINQLKGRIRHRVKTEDYTCRLPGSFAHAIRMYEKYRIKSRVRHRLSLENHWESICWIKVWK